jgi:diguanylate cyclase (GGDEF)-like protein/PAS domain S-box-containing protein
MDDSTDRTQHRVMDDGCFRQLFDASPDPCWLIENYQFVECNQAAVSFLGYASHDELLDTHPSRLSPPCQPDGESSFTKAERMMNLATQNGLHRFEWVHCKADGSEFLAEVTLSQIRHQGRIIIYCVWRDITARKRTETLLKSSENRIKGILEGAADAIFIVAPNGHYEYANQQACALLGYATNELVGKSILDITSPQDHQDILRGFKQLQDQGYLRQELRLLNRSGIQIPVELNARMLPDGTSFGSCRDISERKLAEDYIEFLAHHDTLTGLYNRASLASCLNQALATARRERRSLAVMFLDLDRFKSTNDTLGHAAGDELLVEVSHRIRRCVRESDIVARLSGDEFVIVLTDLDEALTAARLAERIRQAIGQSCTVSGLQVHTTPSIGMAFFPADGDDAETLMKHADTAMYHAKSQGRNNIQCYTPELNQHALKRMRLEHDLREALAKREFELHYQPQVEASSGRIIAFEALVRWRSPTLGLVMPGDFIPLAEESGLILPLGEWVTDEACRQLSAWRTHSPRAHEVHVAVNLSAMQLRSDQLLEFMAATLEKHGLAGRDLELEVTESAMMDDPVACISRLRALRRMGIRLSIDDFGTGYSSLSHLKLMPLDILKIDRAFVRDIETDHNDVVICTATIALAHNLEFTVIAEGVETTAQRDLLVSHGCDFLQGYYFSKPVNAETALGLLQETSTAVAV